MKAAVVIFPGSNRDVDVIDALTAVSGKEPLLIWHRNTELPKADLIVLPGGFSYGDYLRSGAMAARSPILKEVTVRAQAGVAVLGICNGFQILTEAGLLPGVLMANRDLKFVCRNIHLKVERTDTVFTERYAEGQVIRVPVAHHDGNYFSDSETLTRIEGEGQVAFRYCTPEGHLDDSVNPNGSINGIAGVYNENRNVLGLMPHPEDHIDESQSCADGRPLFESLVESLA
ncbi:MAG: phosphoribosylformylglycinamidine synthase I [Alphaproteobacteria bacterium]|nr:phosphoribosylformylglycinamidine synthase I [Alphaproteobacteria bacterium]